MTTRISTNNLDTSVTTLITVASTPKISNVQITSNAYSVLDDTAVDTAGGFIRITGTNFATGCQVLINNTPATSVTFVSSTEVRAQVPAQSAGTYTLYVVNSDGGVAIRVNGVNYSGVPAWSTTSPLTGGVVNSAISLQLSAASNSTVTYALQAGSSLPTGLTLAANGLISGTVTGITSDTTYNFTVVATDVELQDTARAFSITITASDQFFKSVTTLLSANNPTSTFVTDASTNGFAVTVFGDTRPSNFGPYTPGYYSVYFDGTGDYLTLPNNAAFAFGTGAYTVEAWIYATEVQAYAVIFTAGVNGLQFGVDASGYIAIAQTNVNFELNSTTTVPLNQWNHVAVSRNSANVTSIFLNGSRIASGTVSTNYSSATGYINLNPYNSNDFTGYFSNLRVVKGTAVYDPTQTTITVPTTPLTAVANTQLLTCQSNRFIDNSTNNFTITRNGDTLISSFDPFVPSTSFAGRGSGYFDGTTDSVRLPSNAISALPGDFTLELWIYLISTAGNPVIYLVNASQGLIIYVVSGKVVVRSYGTADLLTSVDNIQINTWTHIAVARSGSTLSLWLNGSRASGGTITYSTAFSQGEIRIATNENDAQSTNGYIADLRLIKGTAQYNPSDTTITIPTAPLTAVANTQLLILQNNQPNNNNMFLDSSTNNFNITRNGNTTQGTFSPYGGGWSAYFDGSSFQTIPANAAFNLGTADFTIEFWAFLQPYVANAASSYWASIIGIGVGASDANSVTNTVAIWQSDGTGTSTVAGEYTVIISGSSTNQQRLHSGVTGYNRWTHVALTRSSGVFRLWQDGVLRDSATLSADISRNDYQVIGKSINSNIKGYISNLRVVKGTAVYTTDFTPPTAPLTPITNTSLLTCADNRFIDDSANGFAITTTGTPTVQRFNPFNPVITTPNSYSGYFDGTGDFLSVAQTTQTDLGVNNFTLEMWVYFTGLSASGVNITGKWNSTSQWILQYRGPGQDSITNQHWRFYFNTSAGFDFTESSTTSVATNVWYHIAMVRNGSSWSFYRNGIQIGSTGSSSATVTATSDTLTIGTAQNNTSNLQGYISNYRLVIGTAVYTANFTPPTAPLTAIVNTQLLTLQGTTFLDNSTNAFTITANGDAAPRQFNPFGWTSTTGGSAAYTPALYGGSGYFDGTGDYLSLTQSALAMGTGNFTIECWAYITGSVSNTGVWQLASSLFPSSTSGLAVSAVSSAWQIIYGGTTASGGTAALNTWYHLALVRSGTNLRLYVNGISVISVTDSTNYTGTAISIGGYYTTGFLMTGYISDMRITAGVSRYTSNFQPPIAPLTALQNTVLLNNMTGAGIYDSSMMNNYETVGNASINTSIKKYGNTSMYFDGTSDGLLSPSSPNLSFGSGNFTIELWVYQAGSRVQSFPTLVGNTASWGANGFAIQLDRNDVAGKVTVHIHNVDPTSAAVITSSSSLSQNIWYHVALVRNGATLTLYVNGVSNGSANISTTSIDSGGSSVSTVGYCGGSTTEFRGYIDDLRITKGVARYTTNFTPTATPYIGF